MSALPNCYTSNPPSSFERLSTALNPAWLQEERRAMAHTATTQNDPPSILWEAQQNILTICTILRTNVTKRIGSKVFFNKDENNLRCWNCNENGHYSSQCTKSEQKITTNVYQSIRINPKKADRILFQLWQELDNFKTHDSSSIDSSSEEES